MNNAGSGGSADPRLCAWWYSRDVREPPRRPKQLLAPLHLAGQRIAHSVDQVCLVNQVGDDGAHVASSLQSEETSRRP